jgi:hypothetical protein
MKELSVESGFAGQVATGSLLDTAGNCKNIAVNGSYIIDSTLTDSNYVTVQVNFASGGSYRIFTDTQNGFSFQDSGFMAAGLHSIKLKATGKPVSARQTTFQVAFDTSFCSFTVTVIGNTPANYSLVATSGTCSNPTINGTYTTGTALNANNTVTLEVAVSTPGSYSITTGPIGGMTFSGAGNLTTIGLQIVTLQGSGTPNTAGDNVFPVTAGTSSCSFKVPVTAGTSGTTDPNISDTAWHFTQGSKSFNGPFYDVFDTTINNTYGVVFIGYTPSTGDTTLYFGTFFTGTTIQTGTYSTQNFAAFNFTDYRDTAHPAQIYTANLNTQAANTQLTISSYDPTTKIITGTFTGTAMNASNSPVPITNGRFKAKVR